MLDFIWVDDLKMDSNKWPLKVWGRFKYSYPSKNLEPVLSALHGKTLVA